MGALFLLIGLGLLSLFSLSSIALVPFFKRQLIWTLVGLTLLVATSYVDFRLFRTQSFVVFLFYVVMVFSLALIFLVNLKIRGVESWFRVGGLALQPVELTKIILIILLAKFFSKRHVEIYRIQHLIVSGTYVAIPTLLVLLQPDLGSALILVAIWFAVVIFSGMKLRHLALLVILGLAISFFAWFTVLKPYQKARITSFITPYADTKGASYQMNQSMIAVGSGRLWGKGLGYGSQTHLHFLPEAETDFIFAAFAEEWGYVGVLVLLSLFLLLLWRIVKIGQHAADNFSRLYSLGFAALIFIQSFIHIAMNMGALPITGITLPFVSYGGSSLVTLLIGIGILQNIRINGRKGFEE